MDIIVLNQDATDKEINHIVKRLENPKATYVSAWYGVHSQAK